MEMDHIRQATKNYPRFSDGRIDYTNERVCFVLNCVVYCRDQILLTRRSAHVIAYPNTISGISGFIDRTDSTIADVAKNELKEELGAPLNRLHRLVVSKPFLQIDTKINREWHVYAVLVEFSELFQPVINWENKSAKWFDLASLRREELMKGFDETLNIALALRAATPLPNRSRR